MWEYSHMKQKMVNKCYPPLIIYFLQTKCCKFWQRIFSGHSHKNQTCLTAGTLAFYLFELPPFSFKVKYEGFGSDWKVAIFFVLLVFIPILFRQGSPTVCEFSVSRHFFKTNVTLSVAELILYSKKHKIVVIFYQIFWINI